MKIFESTEYIKEVRAIAQQIPRKDCSVLITGATGMIGSVLVDAFLTSDKEYNNNIRVFALGRNKDRLINRFSYCGEEYLSFIFQDVVQSLQAEEDIDYIIHTASNADPVSYAQFPAETLLTNIYGTKNMLDYCKSHQETRLLVTSTFETYGKIDGQDVYKEEDSGEIDLNQIRSCYPESKRCAEILMRCYGAEYNTDFVIARLCSIYGPTMSEKDSKAHAQFIRNGFEKKDIILKSEGQQKRTYCYVMDAVTGLLTVLFYGKSREAYNISNENSIATIASVAKTVAAVCGTNVVYSSPSKIEKNGFSRPQNCILDNRKLKELNWCGQYSLLEGIQSTIEIMKETQNVS